MEIFDSIDGIRSWRARYRHKVVAFVPTMGNLHEGHVSLVKVAKKYADFVVVSIFVNPTQFNQAEDFSKYPRTLEQDYDALRQVECDACFIPNVEMIYPPRAQTRVYVSELAQTFCGATRPGHFEGVCTVVTALFNIIQCQVAVFGRKDFQQLAIIQQMVRDLHMPIRIVGVDTKREPHGLAMSSRNHRLTEEQRQQASCIYQGLKAAQNAWRNGMTDCAELKRTCLQYLHESIHVDYLEACPPETLEYLEGTIQHQHVILAIACFIGDVRLIDHIHLKVNSY